MMKRSFLYSLLFFLGLSLAAQSCKPIKTYAFKRQYIPGNISVDDQVEGQPPRQRFIYEAYVETNCKTAPQIVNAWIDGNSYNWSAFAVAANKANVGVNSFSGTPVILKAASKNYLYKIEFQPADTVKALPTAYKGKTADKILLQMKADNKTMFQLTPAFQLLESTVMP